MESLAGLTFRQPGPREKLPEKAWPESTEAKNIN